MAKSIFLDITWQHEAYLQGGIAEIEQLYEDGEITMDMRDAWRDIDSGDSNRVLAGTIAIVQREQLYSLRQGYLDIELMGGAGAFGPGGGWLASFMSCDADSGLAGVPKFIKVFPSGNFASHNRDPDKNPRWVWMRDYVIPAFAELSQEDRNEIVKRAINLLKGPPVENPFR